MQPISLSREKNKVSDYNFFSIKEAIVHWYNEQFYHQEGAMISKNTNDILIIDFDFDKCLAQLTVSKDNHNPFQYVYFEAVDFENDNKIYCFFDNERMKKRQVIIAIEEAYKYCLNYRMC